MLAGSASAGVANDVYGRWLTQAHDAEVTIGDCGDGTPCGAISWVQQNPKGVLDSNNPTPALRTHTLVGVQMLYGFHSTNTGWESGEIYDANSGRTYTARISQNTDGTLSVAGCFGPFCQRQTWTRVK